SKIDERRGVSVAPLGVPRARRGIPRDGDLETMLEQVAQVRFDADVGQHPPENDLPDATLAQLQDEVVGLRTPDLVRTDDDRLPILDVGLEALEPVRRGSREPIEGQRSPTSEYLVREFARLQGVVELPAAVRRVEVVRRDEDLVPMVGMSRSRSASAQRSLGQIQQVS